VSRKNAEPKNAIDNKAAESIISELTVNTLTTQYERRPGDGRERFGSSGKPAERDRDAAGLR
jgi:hypothetical protein